MRSYQTVACRKKSATLLSEKGALSLFGAKKMNKIEGQIKDKMKLIEELFAIIETIPDYTGSVELFADIRNKSISRNYARAFFSNGKIHCLAGPAIYILDRDYNHYWYCAYGETLGYKSILSDSNEYDIDERIQLNDSDIQEINNQFVVLTTGNKIPNIPGLIRFETEIFDNVMVEFDTGNERSNRPLHAPIQSEPDRLDQLFGAL